MPSNYKMTNILYGIELNVKEIIHIFLKEVHNQLYREITNKSFIKYSKECGMIITKQLYNKFIVLYKKYDHMDLLDLYLNISNYVNKKDEFYNIYYMINNLIIFEFRPRIKDIYLFDIEKDENDVLYDKIILGYLIKCKSKKFTSMEKLIINSKNKLNAYLEKFKINTIDLYKQHLNSINNDVSNIIIKYITIDISKGNQMFIFNIDLNITTNLKIITQIN